MRRLWCRLFGHWDRELEEIEYNGPWFTYEQCRVCGCRLWIPS